MGGMSKSHPESDPVTTPVARPARLSPVTAPPPMVPAVPQNLCASFSLGGKAGAPYLGSPQLFCGLPPASSLPWTLNGRYSP